MEVTPSRLRAAADALHELSTAVRAALSAGDRAGPGASWAGTWAGPAGREVSAWATDTALGVQVAGWDGYLAGLADRLGAAGDNLATAADGYASTDLSVGRRLW
jgi:uncharacterized protein YukE